MCVAACCRFEVEENELVEHEMEMLKLSRYDPVVYCYELQLHPCVHRKGLGKRLMQMLELVVRTHACTGRQGAMSVGCVVATMMACS